MLNITCSEKRIDEALSLLQLTGRRGPLREALLARGGWPTEDVALSDVIAACELREELRSALQKTVPAELRTRVLRWLSESPQRFLLPFASSSYPATLLHTPSAPMLLFGEGDAALLNAPTVAVVGSRTPTPLGAELAGEFARSFADAGLCVVSGLAAGIDAAAHRAALHRLGKTLAVLGCGPDIAFPVGNAALMQAIAAHGLVLTEHPPGVHPVRTHFPARNRIVAGLGLATVVIEARMRSGALISARLAADAGREVFAVPGSVRNRLAEGCHRLIKDGAGLATCAEEVLAALAGTLKLQWPQLAAPALAAVEDPGDATATWPADHKHLWSTLSDDPTPMDQLIALSGLTYPEIGPILLAMELEGRVEQHFGRYRRRAPGMV